MKIVSHPHRLAAVSFVLVLFALIPLSIFVVFGVIFTRSTKSHAEAPATVPYPMKVLSIRYFPIDSNQASGSAQLMDATTSAVPAGTTVDQMRSRVDDLRNQTINALKAATRYHGYKDANAISSLNYSIEDEKEFLKPIPKSAIYRPTADHFKMLAGNEPDIGITNICDYVENRGVKEVWVWMYHTYDIYHPDGVSPVESNMAPKSGGAFGSPGYSDVSNSDHVDDLPRCAKSYVVYDFNYNRGITLHTFGHQIESVMTAQDRNLIGIFIQPYGLSNLKNHCGNVHWPPNTSTEYDYSELASVQSDCQNWKPDGSGQPELINCHTWAGQDCSAGNNIDLAEQKEHIWWMQNIPGFQNGLVYGGKQLQSFWDLYANFDNQPLPPQVSVDPLPSQSLSGTTSASANAVYSLGIEKVEFYLDLDPVPFSTLINAPYTVQIDTTQLFNGGHKLRVKAYGKGNYLGNTAISSDVHFDVSNSDNQAPAIVAISPKLGEKILDNNVTITVEASDNVGIGTVYLSVDYNIYTLHKAPFSITLNLENGTHHYSAQAADLAGNLSEPLNGWELYFNVDGNFDSDKDGFSDRLEKFMGTDPFLACGVNSQGQSGWPPDIDNNKTINSTDLLRESVHSGTNTTIAYDKRFDMDGNGILNATDLNKIASLYGKKCLQSSPVPAPDTKTIPLINCTYSLSGKFLTITTSSPIADIFVMDSNENIYPLGEIGIVASPTKWDKSFIKSGTYTVLVDRFGNPGKCDTPLTL